MDRQLIEVIEKLGTSFEEFKQASDKKVDALSKKIEQLEIRQARPTYNGVPESGTSTGKKTIMPGEVRILSHKERLSDLVPQIPDVRPEDLSLGRLIRAAATGDWSKAPAEQKAMSGVTGSLGGFLVPAPISAEILDVARSKSVLSQAGMTVVPMESETLSIVVGASDPTITWRAENQPIIPSDPTFMSVTLTAKTCGILIKCPIELLEDAANLQPFLTQQMTSVMALAIDQAGLNGTGGNMPVGLMSNSYIQRKHISEMPGGGSSFADFRWLAKCKELIETANGPSTGLSVVMHPRSASDLAQLQDQEDNPLLMPESVRSIQQLTTTSIPINASDGSNNDCTSVLVGDFSQLIMGLRGGIRVEISREAADEDYSAFRHLQVWLRCYARIDIYPVRPSWFVEVDQIRSAA